MLKKISLVVTLLLISVSITFAGETKNQIIQDMTGVCIKRIIPDAKPGDVITEKVLQSITTCVNNQIKSAYVLSEGVLDTIEEMEDGPKKTVLMSVVVKCYKINRVDGKIDYIATLKCFENALDRLEELVDAQQKRNGL